jgi:Zn-dependent protease with chaperone function
MRFFEWQDQARSETLRLVVLFTLAVAATVFAVHAALALAWAVIGALVPPPRFFSQVNIGVTLLLVLGGWWIETSNLSQPGGAKRLAERLNARDASPSRSAEEQRLCNIVSEVCIAANMPVPEVMVMPRAEAINAFAVGWHPHDAVVAVTQGALDCLTREELQGMVAHECSHILEGDTRLNMHLAGMVSGLELVWRFGDRIRESGGFAWLLGSIVMLVGSFGWFAGRWLQAAVSRQREYLADARAVQWTRSRDGLGGVLRKALTQRRESVPRSLENGSQQAAMHHLLLVGEGAYSRWLDAHPTLPERIARIYGHPMPGLPLPKRSTGAVF